MAAVCVCEGGGGGAWDRRVGRRVRNGSDERDKV